MIKVYIAQHPTEAHLVRGILESSGIDCEVRGESLFTVRGELPLTPDTAPSVWIHDEGLFDEARSVVEDYENSKAMEPLDAAPWTCPSCGEESEDQFMKCWNCGALREA